VKEYKNFKHKEKLLSNHWGFLKLSLKHKRRRLTFRFRYDPVPGIHTDKSISNCFKKPKVTQERRKSFEYSKFIRAKRQNKGLPDPWDDIYIKRPLRNWKRSKKRKQWV
jgi:hypothetical protein